VNKLRYENHSKDTFNGDIVSIDISIDRESLEYTLKQLEYILWQAKEMLNRQALRPKTWEAKVESPVVQLEQESSTPNNDQKSQEKEQSQKIVKTSNISEHYMPSTVNVGHTGKQYIITHPEGFVTDANGEITSNQVIAESLIIKLKQGSDTTIPNTWKVQVIDL
jgi:hypothetical protein